MPIRLRSHHALTFAVLILGALLLAPSAQAAPLSAKLTAAKAKKRTCQARLATGASVVRRSFRASENGLVSARLTPRGKRRGDWDLAVFSRKDGRLVAASAYRGAKELR